MTKITIPKFDPVYNTVIALGGNSADYLLANPVNSFVTKSFTIECWMLADNNTTGTILSYTLAGEKSLVITDPSNINIYINNEHLADTNVSFVDADSGIGEWCYFSLTWESTTGNLLLYKDGSLVYSTLLAANTTIPPDGSLVIGQLQGGAATNMSNPFKGKITQFRIWDNVRPEYYIEQDMNRNIYGNGVLASWQLSSLHLPVNQITGGWYVKDNELESVLIGVVPQSFENESYLVRSVNNGLTWENPKPNKNNRYYNISLQQQSNTVWASLPGPGYNIWTSPDNGTTWADTYSDIHMSVNAAVPDLMLGIGTDNSLWAMVAGAAFAPFNADYPYSWVCALSSQIIYAITANHQLVLSTQGGTKGAFKPVATFTKPVKMVQANNNIVAVLTMEGEIYFSIDQAATWTELVTDSLMRIAFINIINYELWAVNTSNQVFRTTVNMKMIVNWPLNEGYGCFGFDDSGSNNNAYINGCSSQHGEEAWEISTIVRAPQFIESNTDMIPYIAENARRELYLDAKMEEKGPVIGEGLIAKIAEEATMMARRTTGKAAATATASQKVVAVPPKAVVAKPGSPKKAAPPSSSKK
ncbi:LamG-like jellyroll fold domain-containing protein [Chitinophaga sp. Cy-1792]|uniref:LamG-like jellyroll fold domain-containing protein n=1 Tax=Chitinophaga sp. Cy-1792 TaxID=2608339 RepID=UPI00141E8EDB|nr:LamG-like jellyroll fold domain-containing protein [Chitinophaga sp. Cy-1792]